MHMQTRYTDAQPSLMQCFHLYLYKHKINSNDCSNCTDAKQILTLYSKQDTQIVRSSSSLLSCEGGMSTVQRWIRLLSAFFITHRKHTNRWRLVSAARVAMDLPCWGEGRRETDIQCDTVKCRSNWTALRNTQTHIHASLCAPSLRDDLPENKSKWCIQNLK